MKLVAVADSCRRAAWPQVAADANKGYKTKEGRDGVAKTLDNPQSRQESEARRDHRADEDQARA